jgi:hypothetical protein
MKTYKVKCKKIKENYGSYRAVHTIRAERFITSNDPAAPIVFIGVGRKDSSVTITDVDRIEEDMGSTKITIWERPKEPKKKVSFDNTLATDFYGGFELSMAAYNKMSENQKRLSMQRFGCGELRDFINMCVEEVNGWEILRNVYRGSK